MSNLDSKEGPSNRDWSEVVSQATEQVKRDAEAGLDSSGPRLEEAFLFVSFGAVLALLVAIWVPRLAPGGEAASLPLSEQGEDLRIEAALLVEEVEAYRADRGELPPPDYFAAYLDSGYDYQVVDAVRGKYIVRRYSGGVSVTYDGTMSLSLWLLLGGISSGGG